MIQSILQEKNSPTLGRETVCDKGGKLYPTITNQEGKNFDALISYWMTGPDTFDYNYTVIGQHNIRESWLKEIIEELIQKAI